MMNSQFNELVKSRGLKGLTPTLLFISNGHNKPWICPNSLLFVRHPNKGAIPFDTLISLLFMSFVSSERLKRFALFLLDVTLGRILPHTPYVHSSTLELKWFPVFVFLAESPCILSLSLLSFNRLRPPRESKRLGGSTCVHEIMPKVDELTVHGSILSRHKTQAFTSIKHIPSI